MCRTFYEIASHHINSSLEILEQEAQAGTRDNAEKTLLGMGPIDSIENSIKNNTPNELSLVRIYYENTMYSVSVP